MKIKRLSFSVLFGLIFISVIFTFYYTFSLDDSYRFESSVYSIEDSYILGISSKTDVELFYQYFDIDNCSIEVVDSEGKEIKKGYVYNGSETLLYDHSHNVISRYRNIIRGDISKDGVVDNKDLEMFGKSLVYQENLVDYQLKAMDMDNDGKAMINDLVAIDKLLNQTYQSVTLNYEEYTLLSGEELRLVGNVSPNVILNQNLIWKSSDNSIASVSQAGVVLAVKEGEAIISVTTIDNKVSTQMKVVVDDTIRLKENEGFGYVNGEKVRVGIRSVDYDNLSCESSDSSIASCQIENDMLVVEPLQLGDVVITVNNKDYGSATYYFSSYRTYINIFPSYQCLPVNSGRENTFSSFYSGELSFEINDKEIIRDVYVYSNRFVVKTGGKPGRGEVSVKESNGSSVKVFIADVYDLQIPAIGGFMSVGQDFSTDIVGGNLQNLECTSKDEAKATCRIEGNKLIVSALQKGEVYIYVKNKITYNNRTYDCGEATFLAVIRE